MFSDDAFTERQKKSRTDENLMKTVAILLAAYNGEKWIREQIDSVLNQKDVAVTVFVSLDLSTDKTMDILNSYSNNKVILLSYAQRFGAAAPNFYHLIKSVDFSVFDYIALSDQDDIWLADKMNAAINKLESEDAVAYSSNVTAFWANGRKRAVIKATPQRKYDYLFESPGPGCSFVMKKEFALEFQNYMKDKDLLIQKLDWHDWAIYAYARSKNYKWIIDSKSYMLYRQHSNNQLGANSGINQFVKRMNDILNGYGIHQTVNIIHFLNIENENFVKNWLNQGRNGYLYLSKKSRLCRRRKKDQVLFWFSCVLMWLKNVPMESEK